MYAKFINGTGSTLAIEVFNYNVPDSNAALSRSLEAGESYRGKMPPCSQIYVKDPALGTTLDAVELFMYDPLHRFFERSRSGRSHTIHLLLTTTGIHPIQLEYLPDWASHISEIESQRIDWRCPSDSKTSQKWLDPEPAEK